MAGTTITPTALFGPAVIGNAAAALYTAPSNSTVTINRVVVTNTSGSAVGLTIWVVRSGGATSNGNIVIGSSAGGQSISAGASEPYIANALASLVLNAGDALWAEASASGALNALGSGWVQ